MLVLLAGCLTSPATSTESTAQTQAPPTLSGPIGEWLPNTSWSCETITANGPTKYEVANTWSFTDTSWSSDWEQREADAANSGAIDNNSTYALDGWITNDGTGFWSPTSDPLAGYWFAATDRTVLLEMPIANGSWMSTIWTINRYEATDGSTHAEFIMPSQMFAATTDCALSP